MASGVKQALEDLMAPMCIGESLCLCTLLLREFRQLEMARHGGVYTSLRWSRWPPYLVGITILIL